MTDEIKYIDIKEFRELGFLQEANRKFFHPLGLAIEVIIEEDGSEKLGRVWDYREDAEGNFFGKDTIKQEKVDYVEKLRSSKTNSRKEIQDKYNIKVDENGIQII